MHPAVENDGASHRQGGRESVVLSGLFPEIVQRRADVIEEEIEVGGVGGRSRVRFVAGVLPV